MKRIKELMADSEIEALTPADGMTSASRASDSIWHPAPALSEKPLRVHILALGDVGMTMLLGLRLLGADRIGTIGIYDIKQENLERLEMEINQIRSPEPAAQMPPVEIITEEELFCCDVFIFTASRGVPDLSHVGDVRMAQLKANQTLIAYYGVLARRTGYTGQICIVSDPVDPLCKAFLKASRCNPGQIRGFGLGVMNARAAYYAERDPRFRLYLTEGRVYGPHGTGLIVADSVAHYHDDVSRELTDLVINANLKVRALGYKPYIAPALSSAALSILALLRGEWHYSSLYLGSEEEGAFLGIRNRMTSFGNEAEDLPLPDELYHRILRSYQELLQID